jgi:flagellar L-ring protein FlgH
MKGVRMYRSSIIAGVLAIAASTALAQNSSMMQLPGPRAPHSGNTPGLNGSTGSNGASMFPFAASGRETSHPGTRSLEMTSFIAIPPTPPRKFKVEDLVTIIVRQQKKYSADGKLDNKKQWNIDGQLSDWFKFYGDDLGASKLSKGKPGFQFDFNNKYKGESTNDRQDTFTTRIQARVIDVKPNGNLVLEAMLHETHDEEEFDITLTGSCRSEDVTPDNSILSTQVANLVLLETNHGAVRDGSRRGWLPWLMDKGRPF